MMPGSRPSLFRRPDTFFGVCEAVGEDFGFNPIWLRLTLGILILWNPAMVFGCYLGLGVLVALSRWVYPSSPASGAASGQRCASECKTLDAQNDDPVDSIAAAA